MEKKFLNQNKAKNLDSTSTRKPGLRNHEKSHEKVFIFKRTSKNVPICFATCETQPAVVLKSPREHSQASHSSYLTSGFSTRHRPSDFERFPQIAGTYMEKEKREKMAPWDFYPANFKETAPEGFFLVHTRSLSAKQELKHTRPRYVRRGWPGKFGHRVLAMGGRHYVELFRVRPFFSGTIILRSYRFDGEALWMWKNEPLVWLNTHTHTHTRTHTQRRKTCVSASGISRHFSWAKSFHAAVSIEFQRKKNVFITTAFNSSDFEQKKVITMTNFINK